MKRFRTLASLRNPSSARRPRLLASAGVFVLTLVIAGKALAVSMAEYALLLALIAISLTIAVVTPVPSNGHGLHAAVAHIQADAEAAALAHLNGKRGKEGADLGKVIREAKAMTAVTSTCSADDELTSRLGQIEQVAAQLKARAAHPTCKPDGIISDKEQCDPLASPTGCPILTLPSFCSDECACTPLPSQPIPCGLPFPATCNNACQCQPTASSCSTG